MCFWIHMDSIIGGTPFFWERAFSCQIKCYYTNKYKLHIFYYQRFYSNLILNFISIFTWCFAIKTVTISKLILYLSFFFSFNGTLMADSDLIDWSTVWYDTWYDKRLLPIITEFYQDVHSWLMHECILFNNHIILLLSYTLINIYII